MFFAFNNGISATAMDVEIANTDHGRFITFARDFQIINGGQTTASISNARYKDKADLNGIYVQMKLTVIDESSPEESDELIRIFRDLRTARTKSVMQTSLPPIRSTDAWSRFPGLYLLLL